MNAARAPIAPVLVLVVVLVAAFAFACGGTVDPSPVDGGSGAPGAGDRDGSSADAGLAPIPCGEKTCAGATPYCLMAATCGFGPSECTTPTSDAGACPGGYAMCDDSSGKPGCAALYTYSCVASPRCSPMGPRNYGNCTC